MKRLLRKRLKSFVFFLFLILLVCACLLWQYQNKQTEVRGRVLAWTTTLDEQELQISLGTFADQNVDHYLLNLSQKIITLRRREALQAYKLEHSWLLPELDPEEIKTAANEVHQELERFYLDNTYMALASMDYHLFRTHKTFVDAYLTTTKTALNLIYTFKGLNSTGIFVNQGDIIGLQGCTGVCTGTHVHFVMKKDGVAVDPCQYLPQKELSRWGVADICGGAESVALIWPALGTWIITQNYGDISPVTNTYHDALDLIARDYYPVFAAHSGWLYTEEKDCQGAYICNKGHANIVSVCSEKGCAGGIETQYWHLEWMPEVSTTK